jgi:hypothetical protein
MVIGDVGGHYLHKTEDRVWMLRLKLAQNSSLIRTQLEVGLLNQVVDHGLGIFSPFAGNSVGHSRNDSLEPVDKLSPGRRVPLFSA